MIQPNIHSPPKLLDASVLNQARQAIAAHGSIESILDDIGFDSQEQALAIIAETLGMKFEDVASSPIDASCLQQFPVKLIHRFNLFPLRRENNLLVVAVSDPFDLHAIDAVSSEVTDSIKPVVAVPAELGKIIKRHLGLGAETIDGLIAQKESDGDVEILEDVEFDGSEDSEMAQQASVVRLVNEILAEAIEARASDIHMEVQESGIKIRYRIDGVLQRQPAPPEIDRFRLAIISRLKIMAKMNIAEKRVPQDGRIKLRVLGREIDIRVSIIPMLHGEGIVMRILDKDNLAFSLRGIGMSEEVYQKFQNLIRLPHGIILVTGPTGSGKTTTLYSALAEIKNEETKIITTEDPIEYQLEGINQIQVNAKVGLTFSSSLRSILRHYPDVVLVVEIRDLETAENATQASLTGHLVFSTLHTNDSAGAFMRLCDMGVEPFLVSSTVEGIMAQRLVRSLCKDCRQPVDFSTIDMPEDFPSALQLKTDATVYAAKGCRECRNTGYRGRTGIYELLVANDEIRRLANDRAPTNEIKKTAVASGMTTLRMDGWNKVLAGITTIDEVLRVTKSDQF